jgi:ankyrin repeat protein
MLHKEWIEYLKQANNTSNNFKNYYMSRKLRRFIKIDRKLLETNKEDQFIIVHTKEEFNEKCSQKLKNVHYLIQDQSNPNHHFVWQNSNGPISTLKKYVITNKECEELIDEEEIFHKNNERVLIISAEPGMGKSLILDNFTQNSSAENFFIKIILNTCKETLSNTNFKENLSKDLIEFVLKSLLNKTNELEISLLKHLAKEEKLILMFDGLDEVTDYKEQVIQLIDALIKDKRIKRILITTRNQLREELEDHFRTFSFNLNNFDDKDQKNFLHKYWGNLNLKNQARPTSASKFMQSAEDLIERIKSINLNELIGIPLQTKMLADIYFEKVKNEEEFSKLILTNIADLYNQFIESKIEIQFERTNNNTKIASLSRKFKEYFEDSKQKFYSNHIKLSSLILFEQNNQNDMCLELNEILEYGVIVAFTVNKTPTFLHQSFAEFFLAKSCLQKIQKQKRIKDDKELEQILRDKRHFLIRKFLNDLIMGISEYQKEQQKEAKEDLKQEIENCCRENLVSLLKNFIEDKGAKLYIKNEFLIEASFNNHKDIVAFLLEKGIGINQTDQNGRTALMEASEYGHVEIVKLLLAKENIEINQKDKYGQTALIWASRQGHVEIVKLLLAKENIEINQTDNINGNTALIWASIYGHVEIVKLLLAKDNIKINQTDGLGRTALMWASEQGHEEIVKLQLAKENIEINLKDKSGCTALMRASSRGHVEIVKILLENKNIEINQTDNINGWTALIWASEGGHVEIVNILLEKENIEINQQDEIYGRTAIIYVSKESHVEIVKLLLENKNIEINQEDKYRRTALIWASRQGHVEIVKLLLAKENIEINQQNKWGKTALIWASRYGHVEIVKLLLAKENIEINQTDQNGWTALMEASEEGHVEIVKLLLAKDNIEINQQNKWGNTALMWASKEGHVEIVKLLLEKENIEINQEDKSGWTALILASIKGHVEIVKLLLEKENIEINQEDTNGNTA